MTDVKEAPKPKITEIKKVRVLPKPSTPVVIAYVLGIATGVAVTLTIQGLFGDDGPVSVNLETSGS